VGNLSYRNCILIKLQKVTGLSYKNYKHLRLQKFRNLATEWQLDCVITKSISLGVSTVETNRDRDFLICQDQFLKPVQIIHRVETKIFYFSDEINLYQDFYRDCQDKSRLSRLFEIYRDCQDFLRFIEISPHF
jgi:hypothetical protein